MAEYYLSVCRHAWKLFTRRGFIGRVVSFLTQSALVFFVLYMFPWFGSITEKGPFAIASGIALLLSQVLLLLIDLIKAPAELHANQKSENKALAAQVEALTERARPRVKIEGLAQKANDPRWYLKVHNPSNAVGLRDCLAQIDELRDSRGNDVWSHVPLRTENQVEGRPEGRFNLDAGQSKRILLCEPASGSFSWRILGAQDNAKKLQTDDYRMRVRITGTEGGPQDVLIRLNGSTIGVV
jgi:hypothetical protein